MVDSELSEKREHRYRREKKTVRARETCENINKTIEDSERKGRRAEMS